MNYHSPKEIAAEFLQNGLYKTKLPFIRFALLAFLGGTFIAFGGLLTVMVSGGMPGIMASNPGLVKFMAGALFPVGLIMVSVAGADLFTSDCTGIVLPWLDKQINWGMLLKVWAVSYVFNFIGAQFVAWFMTYQTDIIGTSPWKDYLHHLAAGKMSHDFWTVFIKGVGANWLVCLGTWMGFAAKDIVGKAVGIWIPVMIFVTLGYEHSIANMFFIPAAMYTGADITWLDFVVKNLIPATLGNILGGALLVGSVYWYIYLKKTKSY
jgi:formate/nitrite transporter